MDQQVLVEESTSSVELLAAKDALVDQALLDTSGVGCSWSGALATVVAEVGTALRMIHFVEHSDHWRCPALCTLCTQTPSCSLAVTWRNESEAPSSGQELFVANITGMV